MPSFPPVYIKGVPNSKNCGYFKVNPICSLIVLRRLLLLKEPAKKKKSWHKLNFVNNEVIKKNAVVNLLNQDLWWENSKCTKFLLHDEFIKVVL